MEGSFWEIEGVLRIGVRWGVHGAILGGFGDSSPSDGDFRWRTTADHGGGLESIGKLRGAEFLGRGELWVLDLNEWGRGRLVGA